MADVGLEPATSALVETGRPRPPRPAQVVVGPVARDFGVWRFAFRAAETPRFTSEGCAECAQRAVRSRRRLSVLGWRQNRPRAAFSLADPQLRSQCGGSRTGRTPVPAIGPGVNDPSYRGPAAMIRQ